MAYRHEPADAQLARLEDLVASQEELRNQHRAARREHDQASAELDELGQRLAVMEREAAGGVVATVKGWLGSSDASARELDELRRAVAIKAAHVASLVEAERAANAKLEQIDTAKVELAQLVQTREEALRRAEGPRGDELRALDAAVAADASRLAALDAVIAIADRAERASDDLQEIVAALQGAIPKAVQVLSKGLDVVDVIDAISEPSDKSLARARLNDHLPFVAGELGKFGDAFGELGDALRDDDEIRFAHTQLVALSRAPMVDPPEHSDLVVAAASAASWVDRLHARVVRERSELEAHRDELTRQKHALARGPR